jgi:hypothetical protein
MKSSDYPSRDSLFGDMPLEVVIDESRNSLCHERFADASKSLAAGDNQRAQDILHAVVIMPGIESRYQIQAWHLYRLLGGRPTPDLAKLVLGVIVEVGIDKGNDLLAVYADRTAHYHNHAGSVVIWKRPNESLDGLIDSVLRAAATVVDRIGPWQGMRRPPPRQDHMRLNILTPSGIHFGEGPFDQLQRDKLAKHLVLAATNVMTRLTTLAYGPVDLFPSN